MGSPARFAGIVLMLVVAVLPAEAAEWTPVGSNDYSGTVWCEGHVWGPRYNSNGDIIGQGSATASAGPTSDTSSYVSLGISADAADTVWYPHLAFLGEAQAGATGRGWVSSSAGEGEPPPFFNDLFQSNVYGLTRFNVSKMTWMKEMQLYYIHDSFETQSQASVGSVGDGDGYVYYRIDPIGSEQVGDPILTSLEYYGGEDYGGEVDPGYSASCHFSIKRNGTEILDRSNPGGWSYKAMELLIGDVIGVQASSSLSLNCSAVVPTPSNPYANDWTMAYAQVYMGVNLCLKGTPGSAEDSPMMPDNDRVQPGDPFLFSDIDLTGTGMGCDSPMWFDPPGPVVGYELVITGGLARAAVLPNIWDNDGCYSIRRFDGTCWVLETDNAAPGSQWDFTVSTARFIVDDIEADPPLDPSNTLAFPVGILFEDAPTGMDISMTPLFTPVPEPGSLTVLLLGGAGLLALRRHRGKRTPRP